MPNNVTEISVRGKIRRSFMTKLKELQKTEIIPQGREKATITTFYAVCERVVAEPDNRINPVKHTVGLFLISFE
jgi:hypothetical protein